MADVAADLGTGAAVTRRAALNATGTAGLVPDAPTPVGVAALRVPLRVLRADALCAERTVDLAACELVAAPALSLGLLVSADATPAPELTAAPMPRATASPPTRPIVTEAFMPTPS